MVKEQDTFTNREDAERRLCDAFVTLGILAGVNIENGEGPPDLDKDLISACYQSYFGDPHFLGGPTKLIRASSMAHVERIFNSAFDVAGRLLQYIEQKKAPKDIQTAEQSMKVIYSIREWLTKITAP